MNRANKFSELLFHMYQRGHLNDPEFKPAVGTLVRQSTETPLWHLTTDYRSKCAEIQINSAITAKLITTPSQYHSWCQKNLHHEHMVPTSVVIDIIINSQPSTSSVIEAILIKHGLRATIIKSEDGILRKAGFKQKMPASFFDPSDANYGNPLARYIASGLFKKLTPRTKPSWYP